MDTSLYSDEWLEHVFPKCVQTMLCLAGSDWLFVAVFVSLSSLIDSDIWLAVVGWHCPGATLRKTHQSLWGSKGCTDDNNRQCGGGERKTAAAAHVMDMWTSSRRTGHYSCFQNSGFLFVFSTLPSFSNFLLFSFLLSSHFLQEI